LLFTTSDGDAALQVGFFEIELISSPFSFCARLSSFNINHNKATMAAVAAHQTQANPFDDSDDDDDQGVPPPPPGNPIGSPSPSNALSQDYSFGGDDDAAHNAIDANSNNNGKIQQNI